MKTARMLAGLVIAILGLLVSAAPVSAPSAQPAHANCSLSSFLAAVIDLPRGHVHREWTGKNLRRPDQLRTRQYTFP